MNHLKISIILLVFILLLSFLSLFVSTVIEKLDDQVINVNQIAKLNSRLINNTIEESPETIKYIKALRLNNPFINAILRNRKLSDYRKTKYTQEITDYIISNTETTRDKMKNTLKQAILSNNPDDIKDCIDVELASLINGILEGTTFESAKDDIKTIIRTINDKNLHGPIIHGPLIQSIANIPVLDHYNKVILIKKIVDSTINASNVRSDQMKKTWQQKNCAAPTTTPYRPTTTPYVPTTTPYVPTTTPYRPTTTPYVPTTTPYVPTTTPYVPTTTPYVPTTTPYVPTTTPYRPTTTTYVPTTTPYRPTTTPYVPTTTPYVPTTTPYRPTTTPYVPTTTPYVAFGMKMYAYQNGSVTTTSDNSVEYAVKNDYIYKVFKITGESDIAFTKNITVSFILVGGGGGGGRSSWKGNGGGGGGGGGGVTYGTYTCTAGVKIHVKIGYGGDSGMDGGDSVFASYTAKGGKGGAGGNNPVLKSETPQARVAQLYSAGAGVPPAGDQGYLVQKDPGYGQKAATGMGSFTSSMGTTLGTMLYGDEGGKGGEIVGGAQGGVGGTGGNGNYLRDAAGLNGNPGVLIPNNFIIDDFPPLSGITFYNPNPPFMQNPPPIQYYFGGGGGGGSGGGDNIIPTTNGLGQIAGNFGLIGKNAGGQGARTNFNGVDGAPNSGQGGGGAGNSYNDVERSNLGGKGGSGVLILFYQKPVDDTTVKHGAYVR